ncbi:5'-nucleotidase [Sinobacterium caligoides]|uniref:5'-nucleotidase n=1 Tax=Sinobacterium caligoides TaxID=933926 RepID=A0A3N2DZR1_9GAMM|nr:5'-nucleotidase [Sinobacterium caligoides]ROS05318.1 5'-nucleotidase [Sinobacterium caligoides]
MALDLSDTLVVGISATALFDLREADAIFQDAKRNDPKNALESYRQHMLESEDAPLADGTAMPLVKALLDLNQYCSPGGGEPLVEVVVMSRNSPETGIRVFNNIRQRQLAVSRHAFTGGESVVDYLKAYDVDLFLTTNVQDAQRVIDGHHCAAAVLKQPPNDSNHLPEGQLRIAFDGDAVIFDESSELVYKAEGLDSFLANEDRKQDVPMPAGPYATLLKKLSRLQDRLPFSVDYSPVRIAIVTARNAPAELRVIKTLRHWGVYVDEVFFLGGIDKAQVLKAFRPHIFFDDQDLHLERAAALVPSGRVPYSSGSALNQSPEGVSVEGETHDNDSEPGASAC